MNPDWCCLILAAGKGTRLLPLTKHVPKPLFPLLNTPALDRLISKLKEEGIQKIAVNCYHLANILLAWKEKSHWGSCVELLHEKRLLDTGGAIKNLFNRLGPRNKVLVYNADIVSNLPVKQFCELFEKNPETSALFCLHHKAPYNKIRCRGQQIRSFDAKGKNLLAYTGISAFRYECFSNAPTGPFPLIPYIQGLINKGQNILGCRAEGIVGLRGMKWLWYDIGTPEGYLEANFALLHRRGINYLFEKAYIENGVSVGKNVICGKGAHISGNLHLENVIIWPDTRLHIDGKISNAVVTPFGLMRSKIQVR